MDDLPVSPSAEMPLAPPTQRRRWIHPLLYALIVLTVTGGFAAWWWFYTLPDRVDDQQTLLIVPSLLIPDSDASVRVVVQNFKAGKPVSGAQVRIGLKADQGGVTPLFEGQTDESGSLPVRLHVPADAPEKATLVVETASSAGQDRLEQAVIIQRQYRLLLTSDKPLYQPGQVIHMRALALSTLDLTAAAAGATIQFLVQDPQGNKVYRQSVAASEWGIAAADFTLADMVNQGDYKLSVSIGDTTSEKTVQVRPYVLPRFAVQVSTDRTFYLPGQRVQGTVQADYFFGQPVADGQVQLSGSVWDVTRTVVVDLRGETNFNGTWAFAFDLPAYFAGSGLESGQAQFALEVTVIDQADHIEQTSQVLPVAAQPIIIEAVAESGQLKYGVPNIIYVLTSYPDGRPAETRLQVRVDGGSPIELRSGPLGLTELTWTPNSSRNYSLDIIATDAAGLSAQRWLEMGITPGLDSVLLRADRATYLVGDTMNLVALTPVEWGDIYLDMVKIGQTLSTRSSRVKDGKAEFAIDLSPDLYGTLELHAYKVLHDGSIVRDTRLVVVDAANEVGIAIAADKDTYRPGETAAVQLNTGVPAALGLAVVDESVFALQQQDPGFARLYFMLERELLEPFYQIKGFEMPASLPPDKTEIRQTQDAAAKAVWARAAGATTLRSVNSRPLKVQAVNRTRSVGLGHVSNAALVGLMAIPLLLVSVAGLDLWRRRVIKRSLLRLLVATGAVLLIAVCLLGWVIALSSNWYLDPEDLLQPLLGSLGLLMLFLLISVWIQGDATGRLVTLLTLAWVALLGLLIAASDRPDTPNEGLSVVALIASLLIPVAYLLMGQGRWVQQQRWIGGLSTGLGGLLGLSLSLVALIALAGATGAFMQPMLVQATRVVEKVVERARDDRPVQNVNEPPRLRQYFPETLYWAPEILTDLDGQVTVQIPMADSITTWRLTVLASTQDGKLGFTTYPIRVFQDFFVDVDLPVSLTQGDEISIPVAVFNYLPNTQDVRLVAQPEYWFELVGAGEQTLTIAANDVEVVYFPIRVLKFGVQGFQVTAWGSQMSDAVRRQVRVVPNGKEIRLSQSNWLRGPQEITLGIPAAAVPETPRLEVKIYPGVMAQAVEGLEKILRLPHG